MNRRTPGKRVLAIATLTLIVFGLIAALSPRVGNMPVYAASTAGPTAGELRVLDSTGKDTGLCPLKHTDVVANISGYVAHVDVKQTFTNSSKTKVEAVYVFPLPDEAAVDSMTMTIGNRTISAEIKKRQEAQQIYQQAKAGGHVAALLDQERPNIFTQSVANIEPGAQITIDISFVETLKLEDGTFEWVFPMVVGPRYTGGSSVDGSAVPQDATKSPHSGMRSSTPDADRITPPITPKGTRAGHDISVTVHLDAGTPIADIKSVLHDVDIDSDGPGRATITLRDKATIPNKDFILRYRTATDQIGDSFITHTDTRGTYFTLALQPPRKVQQDQIVPKEIVFVLDQTGSQSGAPIEKAKETIKYCIKRLNSQDTFQLLGFNTSVYPCFKGPVPATQVNIEKALTFLKPIEGEGGTDILRSVDYALKIPDDPKRLRIVCYMTDGYVGNDEAIVDYIKTHRRSARMFPFGTGDSVNRYLVDGMARAGGGEPEYVNLNSDTDEVSQRFYDRIRVPVLTNISVDWGGLAVSEAYPRQPADLFSAKPIMIQGRLSDLRSGTITIKGMTADGPFQRSIDIKPAPGDNPALPSLLARAKIDDLLLQDESSVLGQPSDPTVKQITDLGIQYHLTTEYTSFVAVEWDRTTAGGPAHRVEVPVEIPEGVRYEGIDGTDKSVAMRGTPGAGFVRGGAFAVRKAAGQSGYGYATANAPIPAAPPIANSTMAVDKDEREESETPNVKVAVHVAPSSRAGAAKTAAGSVMFGGMHQGYLTQKGDDWTGPVDGPSTLAKGCSVTIAIADDAGNTHEATITLRPSKPGYTVKVTAGVDVSSVALDLGGGKTLPLLTSGGVWTVTGQGAMPSKLKIVIGYANGATAEATVG